MIFFPDSRLSNRWSIETLKTQEQSIHSALQTYERDWKRFDQRKKFNRKALPVAVKKKNKQTNNFSRTYIYIADFFQVWKVAGQISSLFHEFKTLYEPTVNKNEEGEAGGIETCAVDASSSKGCVNFLRRVGRLKCSCCSVTVGCANVGELVQGTGLLSLQI